ncbi:flagellar assembly protein FliW [Lachnospiraceae bacterium 46-15]
MLIQTDYYGEVEYAEEDLIIFPDGLFGFPNLKKYLPLYLSHNDDSIILLQSTEEPLICFAMLNPVYLCPDYAPYLSTEELSFLNVSDSGELCYYTLCTVRDNYLDTTVNLKAPLAINPETHIGMQVILTNSEYGIRHQIRSFQTVCPAENSTDRSAD